MVFRQLLNHTISSKVVSPNLFSFVKSPRNSLYHPKSTMSDQIPFHIQEEIMKRLPVKSLIQFRSVSKAWKSLIDSSEFIAAHSVHRHTQTQHLLVSYDFQEVERKYVSYIDDGTFPQHRSVLTLPLYDTVLFIAIGGSSHGLVCLLKPTFMFKRGMAVLLNPSIRKSIEVAVPGEGEPSVGFGVCPVTSDPKIVAVTQSWDKSNVETSYQCEVMVYTLSSRKWRILTNNLPTEPIEKFWCTMVTDRFIYWRGSHSHNHNMIMSFDVTNESFEAIDLPDSAAYSRVAFSKLRESFVVVEYSGYNTGTVWMLEHGVQKVFTKLFTIKTPHDFIVGFRKSGIPIVRVTDGDSDDSDDDDEPGKLVVCEPNSEHNILLERSPDKFTVKSYAETLLLLGQSDCISY